MLFLVEYDRTEGKLQRMQRFDASQRHEAEDARLALELDLKRKGIEREIVLLEAESEAVLRKTHRRYFESLAQIATLPETTDGDGT